MKKLILAFGAVALLLMPCSVWAEALEATIAGHRTVIWTPPKSATKAPLLLMSHGYDSCPEASTFLTQALADDGYYVFAPEHADAGCGRQHPDMPIPLDQPANWDSTTYVARNYDIHNLLGELRRDPRFKDKIDFTRIGLIGHSLGGYTVLGMAGGWPDWALPAGVKAVLVLSPYVGPFTAKHTLGGLKVPVMFQSGTEDMFKADIGDPGGSYDQAPAPKYYVEFFGAHHLTWTDSETNPYYKDPIITYSKAFLDHYVKGEPVSPALTAKKDIVSRLSYDSELGKK